MLLLLLSLVSARSRKRHSRLHEDLRHFVHALERGDTNADLDIAGTVAAMSVPLATNIRTAYAPGFGPELAEVEAPDEDLPAKELKDARPFPGAGTMYPAAKVVMPRYCCTCGKKGGKSGEVSAFPE